MAACDDDGLGSTTGLTDASGMVTDTYTYDAFGATRSQAGSSGQAFRFTGEQQDGNVAGDLYYLRARYYDPALGRFWARDPFGGFTIQPQSWNAYPYVLSNPVLFADPYGLIGCGPLGGLCKKVKEGLVGTAECLGDLDDCIESGVKAVESWAASVLCPEKGYVDYNVTAGLVVVYTGGIQCNQQQGFFFYYGGGVGAGVAASVTYGPNQQITEGYFCGAQFTGGYRGAGASGQVGVGGLPDDPTFFYEIGGAVYRGSATGAFVGATCADLFDLLP